MGELSLKQYMRIAKIKKRTRDTHFWKSGIVKSVIGVANHKVVP